LRPGASGGDAGQRQLPLGARRAAYLQRRGRAVHQRDGHRARYVTLTRTSMAWSPAWSVSSSRTAGGTAGWSTVRFALRSRPRSGCWKGCWRTSEQPVARRSPSRLDAGDPPDQRVDEAIQLLRSKQQPDGTWLLENTHPGMVHFTLEDGDGRPSRWNTLRALYVLSWYGQAGDLRCRVERAKGIEPSPRAWEAPSDRSGQADPTAWRASAPTAAVRG
jgi:hypothetical protein